MASLNYKVLLQANEQLRMWQNHRLQWRTNIGICMSASALYVTTMDRLATEVVIVHTTTKACGARTAYHEPCRRHRSRHLHTPYGR